MKNKPKVEATSATPLLTTGDITSRKPGIVLPAKNGPCFSCGELWKIKPLPHVVVLSVLSQWLDNVVLGGESDVCEYLLIGYHVLSC